MTSDLREDLAALEHEQWAHWTAYMLQQLELLNAQPFDLLTRSYESHGEEFAKRAVWTREQVDAIQRWVRQITTPYAELSEKEKDSDREWADKVLELVKSDKSKFTALVIEIPDDRVSMFEEFCETNGWRLTKC